MAVEQVLQAIQMQLTSSQEQVATLSAAIDNVRAEASNAVRELRENLAAEMARTAVLQQAVGRGGASSRDWTLVSSKEFGGGKFGGGKGESFKIWSKKAKIFLNIKKEGFKKILEAIEVNEENVVDDRAVANMGLAWGITAEQCKSASAKLADFLQTYCGDDALRVVEACGENGSEAWRQLKKAVPSSRRPLRAREAKQHAAPQTVQESGRFAGRNRHLAKRLQELQHDDGDPISDRVENPPAEPAAAGRTPREPQDAVPDGPAGF